MNAYYRVGDRYFDSTNSAEYICTTAGDKTSSVWAKLTGSASGSVQLFAITALSNADTFSAAPITSVYDSGTSTLILTLGSVVTIAKHNRMRPSVLTETIDSTTITYSGYTSDNWRNATDGTNSEAQVVFPRYMKMSDLGYSASTFSGSAAVAFLNSQCVIKAALIALGGSPISSTGTAAPLWEELTPRVWARVLLNQTV